VLPAASPDAVALIAALLAVNPKRRPTAAQALASPYMRDAATLCDYSLRYLQRAPENYFAFETTKYSLDELKALVHQEVTLGGRLAAADVLTASATTPASSTNPPPVVRRTSVRQDLMEGESDLGAGAVPSQAPTQLKGHATTNFDGISRKGAAPSATVSQTRSRNVVARTLSAQQAEEVGAAPSFTAALQRMKDGDDNSLILTPSQRPVKVANAAKIEAVSQKGAKAKSKFSMQSLQSQLSEGDDSSGSGPKASATAGGVTGAVAQFAGDNSEKKVSGGNKFSILPMFLREGSASALDANAAVAVNAAKSKDANTFPRFGWRNQHGVEPAAVQLLRRGIDRGG
jgi:hypothetical protein